MKILLIKINFVIKNKFKNILFNKKHKNNGNINKTLNNYKRKYIIRLIIFLIISIYLNINFNNIITMLIKLMKILNNLFRKEKIFYYE